MSLIQVAQHPQPCHTSRLKHLPHPSVLLRLGLWPKKSLFPHIQITQGSWFPLLCPDWLSTLLQFLQPNFCVSATQSFLSQTSRTEQLVDQVWILPCLLTGLELDALPFTLLSLQPFQVDHFLSQPTDLLLFPGYFSSSPTGTHTLSLFIISSDHPPTAVIVVIYQPPAHLPGFPKVYRSLIPSPLPCIKLSRLIQW